MRDTTHEPGRFNFKAWFRIHTWSALTSIIILGMLALTGVMIYPLDQFGLRDIPLQSAWLPAIYETNTWRSQMRSLAVAPDGWLFASHRHGLFVSRDGGRSWQDLTARIPGHFAADDGRFPRSWPCIPIT